MAGDTRAPATWETTDIGSAAYAHMRGLKIRSAIRRPGGDFIFLFDDPEQVGSALQIEYANSECRRYDESVRTMKKLCFDGQPRSRGGGGRRPWNS